MRGLQGQLDRYLELLSTTHSTGLRHLTLEALGQGQRELRVSYISEVPVWKSTYRMVFPRVANGSAIVQGWAVVDNTVGADWDNVQLVAGGRRAAELYSAALAAALYAAAGDSDRHRGARLTPQTHEAAEVEEQPVPTPEMAEKAMMAPRMMARKKRDGEREAVRASEPRLQRMLRRWLRSPLRLARAPA